MPRLSATAFVTGDDSALARLARNGDSEALHLLLTRYEPFIKACSVFYGNAGMDADDLMQEGRLGLVSAVQRYRHDRGASFKTFASLCIKRHIVSSMRRATSGKNAPMNNYVSLDDDPVKVERDFTVESPEDIVISMERVEEVKNALTEMFSEFERNLFSLYLSGHSYDDIARRLNVCKKQVDNSLQRIKRKLGVLFG